MAHFLDNATATPELDPNFDPRLVTRPDPRLWKYYLVTSICAGPFFPLAILPLYFKYHTLEYKFDDEGVAMRWGILFRREVYLTYRRIQDIHLTRNIIQRWLGLATVSVQTASGSAMPEMAIEGIPQAEQLRDFFYAHMRGGHMSAQRTTATAGANEAEVATSDAPAPTRGGEHEVTSLLRDIRDDLRRAADRLENAS